MDTNFHPDLYPHFAMEQPLPDGYEDVGVGIPREGDTYLGFSFDSQEWLALSCVSDLHKKPKRIIQRIRE